MTLHEIIVLSAASALPLQSETGAMPAGHNGPYQDEETPVRNTAHWAIVFLKAHEISEEEKYINAAKKCLEFLMSKEARPMGATFFCRKNPHKDLTNGIVGQAWAIEALIQLSEATSNQEALDLALEVFKFHPFVERFGAWKRVNVEGSYNSMDVTFNHQLWFAAIGGILGMKTQDEETLKMVRIFLDRLDQNLAVYSNGLIRHKYYKYLKGSWPGKLNNAYMMTKVPAKYMKMKSVGYHSFNLYGFALLKLSYPEHDFWSSRKFQMSIRYAQSDAYWEQIDSSKYGFPYNPPGIETAFALQVFGGEAALIQKWLDRQFQTTWDPQRQMLDAGENFDSNTAGARLYEATRIDNHDVSLKA